MPDRDKIPYETSLSSLLVNIVKQAQADGIITADEGELINRIQVDARDFEHEVVSARKEGITSVGEILARLKDKMVDNAKQTANQDGVITEEEEALINKLIRELENIELE